MKKFKQKLKYIVLLCLMSISITSFAQDGPNRVGVVVGLDHMIDINEVSPKIGFVYEWTPKRCGIETGIYWRTNAKSHKSNVGSTAVIARINTHYITIPLLFKVNFKPITVSLGPEVDYYLGYSVSESKSTEGLSVEGYSETRVNFGGTFKVGFPIAIRENWIIEPEVRASYSVIDFFVGLGVSIKFGR